MKTYNILKKHALFVKPRNRFHRVFYDKLYRPLIG